MVLMKLRSEIESAGFEISTYEPTIVWLSTEIKEVFKKNILRCSWGQCRHLEKIHVFLLFLSSIFCSWLQGVVRLGSVDDNDVKSKDRTLGDGKGVPLKKGQSVFVIITVAENTGGCIHRPWLFSVKVVGGYLFKVKGKVILR